MKAERGRGEAGAAQRSAQPVEGRRRLGCTVCSQEHRHTSLHQVPRPRQTQAPGSSPRAPTLPQQRLPCCSPGTVKCCPTACPRPCPAPSTGWVAVQGSRLRGAPGCLRPPAACPCRRLRRRGRRPSSRPSLSSSEGAGWCCGGVLSGGRGPCGTFWKGAAQRIPPSPHREMPLQHG